MAKQTPITSADELHAYLLRLAKADLQACRKGELTVQGKEGIGPLTLRYDHDAKTYSATTRAHLARNKQELAVHGEVVPGVTLASGKLGDVAGVVARNLAVSGVPAEWMVW